SVPSASCSSAPFAEVRNSACPRTIGPQEPTRSTYSLPSASCSSAPFAEVRNGGVPPTEPKARTGEFTPEGITWRAREKRSVEEVVPVIWSVSRSEEHTSELQSRFDL